jgi:hypothetical protein
MKKLIVLLNILFLISCAGNTDSNQEASDANESKAETSQEEELKNESEVPDESFGYYVGMFKAVHEKINFNETSRFNEANRWDNKISLSLDSMVDGILFGHSIVAGNLRSFNGELRKEGEKLFYAILKEPGDHKYDGIFNIRWFVDKDSINGGWVSNDETIDVPQRHFALNRRDFEYNPYDSLDPQLAGEVLRWRNLNKDNEIFSEMEEEYGGIFELLSSDIIKLNPSVDALTKEDVENMYKGDLTILRNSVYARHGYSFKNRVIRNIFDYYVDWYMPISVDVREELTEIEKNNIELIKTYEEYAGEYYDSFGR